MIKKVLQLAEAISVGIPASYHAKLEDRLAIAWGERKRNLFLDRPRSRAENISASRKNRAREFYLEAQDKNCLLFLPFILAISPRACADLKIAEIAQLQQYGRDQVQVDASPKTKELIASMAIRRGFSQNQSYLDFMITIFPEGFQKPEAISEAVDPRAGQNFAASSTISASCANTPPPNETQSGATAIPEIPLDNASQQHRVLENASLEGIANVFDEYMCEAIRRDTVQSSRESYVTAAVTMDFPMSGLVDCLMSLAIHESKVEYLAMALFNVLVGSVGNVRYLTLPGGVRVTPNPEVTLKGVLREAIIRTFGPEIYNAVAESSIREKELEEGNQVTEGVSMILTSKTSEGAIINLSLGVRGGVQIKDKIYP